MEVHEKSPSLQTIDVKRKYLLMRSVSDKREGNKQTEHRRLLTSLCHDHLLGIEGVWGDRRERHSRGSGMSRTVFCVLRWSSADNDKQDKDKETDPKAPATVPIFVLRPQAVLIWRLFHCIPCKKSGIYSFPLIMTSIKSSFDWFQNERHKTVLKKSKKKINLKLLRKLKIGQESYKI